MSQLISQSISSSINQATTYKTIEKTYNSMMMMMMMMMVVGVTYVSMLLSWPRSEGKHHGAAATPGRLTHFAAYMAFFAVFFVAFMAGVEAFMAFMALGTFRAFSSVWARARCSLARSSHSVAASTLLLRDFR